MSIAARREAYLTFEIELGEENVGKYAILRTVKTSVLPFLGLINWMIRISIAARAMENVYKSFQQFAQLFTQIPWRVICFPPTWPTCLCHMIYIFNFIYIYLFDTHFGPCTNRDGVVSVLAKQT